MYTDQQLVAHVDWLAQRGEQIPDRVVDAPSSDSKCLEFQAFSLIGHLATSSVLTLLFPGNFRAAGEFTG
jgi:hypothetical protein